MSIIQITEKHVNNPFEFDCQMDELKYQSVFPRVESWLDFFNRHYIEYMLSYSYSVFALIELAQGYPLFFDQSKYEQELSFEFIKKTMKFSPHFGLSGTSDAKYFLVLSLIYGRYHGMVINSIKTGISNLGPSTERDQLTKVFEFLFVKYENPHLLSSHLERLNLHEINLVMHMLQGKNPRTFKRLPYPISKKDSYYFTSLKWGDVNIQQNILKKAIVVSKLATSNRDIELLAQFLQANHYFNFRIDEFYTHLSFWKSVYHFLTKIKWNETNLGITEYVDYFMHKRNNENYSLKGRTPKSVSEAINRWHHSPYSYDSTELMQLNWGKPNSSYFIYESIKYKFSEITNGKRLFQESEKMNHCAFSYVAMCNNGVTSVWSVTKPVKSTYKPVLTLEIQNKEIVQMVTKNNQKPSNKELDMIEKWANREGILVSV